MNTSFLDAMKKEQNKAVTLNGAQAYKTTGTDLLDLFATIGALRGRDNNEVISKFDKAYCEDPLIAMKMLFWARDIRGGLGERKIFKTLITFLAKVHPDIMKKNIHLISEYGRWDEFYALFGTSLESDVIAIMKEQINKDILSETPSLLTKWLKSENTSSKESVVLATKTRKGFGMTSKEYRKMLSALRKKINVLECKLSANEWDFIDYSKLPSKAGLLYRKAFKKHDEIGYKAFLESLQKGEVKVNSATLFPYELVGKVLESGDRDDDILLDGMWKNLPNYLDGIECGDTLPVIDVSGSMKSATELSDSSLPLKMAISLGLYLAERNVGLFKDHFMTFSEDPEFVQVKGSTFPEKVRNISRAHWGYSTNLEAVFGLLILAAKKYGISKEAMPKRVIIISDMQFNTATKNCVSLPLMKAIEKAFEEAGVDMPKLVFWNVNSKNDQHPMTKDDFGTQFVSGGNPVLFPAIIKGEQLTAIDLMMTVIGVPRYDAVTI